MGIMSRLRRGASRVKKRAKKAVSRVTKRARRVTRTATRARTTARKVTTRARTTARKVTTRVRTTARRARKSYKRRRKATKKEMKGATQFGVPGFIGGGAGMLRLGAKAIRFAKMGKGAKAAGIGRVGLGKTAAAKAQEFIQKPFRTALPYAAAAGVLRGAVGFGEEKVGRKYGMGEQIGGVLGGGFPTTIPGGGKMAGISLVEPELVRSWTTGTATFGQDISGQYWVTTKKGWKKYTPKKPIVLGTKHLTPKKFITAANKYYKVKKDLDKVFKTVKRRK